MNMNVDVASKEPLPISTVAAASQAVVDSAQVSRSAVGTTEQTQMEDDTYEHQEDSSSDRKDPLPAPEPRSLQISVSKETGLQIKVINTDTKEVVWEIPPEELQRSMASIRRVSGLLFDKKA